MTKTVLVSNSQGERGANGRKKIYEIIAEGRKVVVRWGKAEEDKRQTQTKWFSSEYEATYFVNTKKWEKIEKGYELVFTA